MDIKKEKKKTVMRGAAIWLENFPLTQEKYPKVNSNLVLVFLKSEGDRKHLLTCDVQSLFPRLLIHGYNIIFSFSEHFLRKAHRYFHYKPDS